MNTAVKYEIAKLLKEKGYNFYCAWSYWDGELTQHTPGYPLEDGTTSQENYWNYERYYAPTISDVVMWLYEEHKLWIYIIYEKGLFHNNIEDTTHTALFEEDCRVFNMCNYKTPTEAYEAAIKYCLENII